MKFGERLKLLRAKKGITQDDLAIALDIPSSTIRRLETDDNALPRRERLEAIADYFNVKVDYLLGRDEVDEVVKGELTTAQTELFKEFEALSEEDKDYVLGLIRRIQGK